MVSLLGTLRLPTVETRDHFIRHVIGDVPPDKPPPDFAQHSPIPTDRAALGARDGQGVIDPNQMNAKIKTLYLASQALCEVY